MFSSVLCIGWVITGKPEVAEMLCTFLRSLHMCCLVFLCVHSLTFTCEVLPSQSEVRWTWMMEEVTTDAW